MLTYFDLRGRAEASRLLLTYLGVAFEDRRVTAPETWDALKKELPFGSLPHYADDDIELTQSHAILRYLARRHQLVGTDPSAMAIRDEAQEVLAEAQENLWAFAWKKEYGDDKQGYADGILRFYLGALARWFERHSGGEFWVGNSVSHVDFLAFVYLDEVRAFFPEALARRESLARFRDRIEQSSGVAEYIGSGRRPVVFGMGLHGPKVDPGVVLESGQTFHSPWTEPIVLA